MKPSLVLPPLAALAVAGLWLGSQRKSISAVESETTLLRQHVGAAKAPSSPDDDRSLAGARNRTKQAKGPKAIGWKELAAKMTAGQGMMPDMRAMMDIQRTIAGMSSAELSAALKETAALRLDPQSRMMLEGMLVQLLSQKDPQLVLEQHLDKLDDPNSSMSGQLAGAFQQWLAKDPAAAAAWYDARIAEGKFESKSLDGYNRGRLQFEAALVSSLLATDPDAAGKRLAVLSKHEQRELFQQGMFMNLKPGSEKAMANLIREHVPEAARGTTLANAIVMMIHHGGYEKVGEFLDGIEATATERKAVATKAASDKLQMLSQQGTLDRAAIDEMRGWLSKQSPGDVDTVTGDSLGNLWNPDVKWEDHAKMVQDLHAEGGSDELLVSFLLGHQTSLHREAALELAAKITDETKRTEIIERIGRGQPVEKFKTLPTR
jgi:hypothetical protein